MNELNEKKYRIQELEYKIQSKQRMGAEVTPGGADAFEKCCTFFVQKAEQADELGDSEAEEIDEFISKYDNAAAITQVLWQLYFLQLEMESEQM